MSTIQIKLVRWLTICSRLVPLEAHEASSLYSEQQAKLLRSVCGEIEAANAELTIFMSALQLEDIPHQETEPIPQEIIECAAGLSVRSATSYPLLSLSLGKVTKVLCKVLHFLLRK